MAVEPCKVFVVAGTSSGVGKTTLAVGLMAMLKYGAHPSTLFSGLVQAPKPADYTKPANLLPFCVITRHASLTRVHVCAQAQGPHRASLQSRPRCALQLTQ